MHIPLSALAVGLGLVVGVPQVYALMKPDRFTEMARRFPRSLPAGYLLMVIATVWFTWNVNLESIADFAAYKKVLLAFFVAVGVGACFFVKDFLAVRGLAVVFLLLAKLMVDTARLADSEWRLVIVTWAYVLIIAGMWLTISPWRLRDLIDWATATTQRVRVFSAIRLAFALLVIVLGLTVFRAAPH